MERLLTPRQISELLQVELSTVYKRSHMGLLPHVKMGRSIRFIEQEVEQRVKQRVRKGARLTRF